MHRFVTLAVLLFFALPFGISISGCGNKNTVTFCNGGSSGVTTGTLATLSLTPRIYGVSLNFAQKSSLPASPTGADCNGASVTPTNLRYKTTDPSIADINPSTGALCGGAWNRNTGGGVPDYSICTATNKAGTAYVTASTANVASNPLPIFVHPVVTGVALGNLSTDCLNDPATNCSPASTSTIASATCTLLSNGCCSQPLVTVGVSTNSCLSQGTTGQLAARVFDAAGNNISCTVGHVLFQPQTSSIVTIDPNGVATAAAPGSTVVTANITQAGSSAGFFSTCPPRTITLNAPGVTSGNPVNVNQNVGQPLTATVLDTNGKGITGLSLELLSTTPTTLPSGASGVVTPSFAGTGAITAQCLPPTCNPSPLNAVGLNGNGLPVISNEVVVSTPGTNSNVLYMGSTNSQYIVPLDFTTGQLGSPVRLPYVPNSMVISNDGSSIYLGNSTELMVFNALSNTLSRQDISVPGTVLAISPDGTTLVIADTARQLIYLANAAGGIQSTYGGIATRAQFTPDSGTVYISAGTQTLVHSNFTGWQSITPGSPTDDVAVAVPSVGAFFGGPVTTARGFCPATTVTNNASGTAVVSNVFYPDAGVVAPTTDRLAATNDGNHILGARAASGAATLTDLFLTHSTATGTANGLPVGSCVAQNGQPLQFTATPVASLVLPGVTATAITGIVPTSDSTIAFVTYSGTGGVLPRYTPATSSISGSLGAIPLATVAGTAPASPVAGVFSADNTTFYAGTAGDNLVHVINRTTLTDQPTKAIIPNLPATNGGTATPDLLVQRPRRATS